MKNYIFEKEKMLKGGLHCHTTRSDGKMEPDEVIRYHKKHGYDFMTLTDHRIYNYTNFAPDVDITIIPGMEFNTKNLICENGKGRRCYHILCLGVPKEDGNGFDQDERTESVIAENQDDVQKYLDEIHQKKNLTVYCHPEWSCTPARYFEKLKGNFAMEIWNSGCVIDDDMDMDASYWDELLGKGIHINGVAVDDGHALKHHCNGWVMVNAHNDINSILNALENGDYYSSCGPEIYKFYVDGETAYIDCSAVSKIRLHSDGFATKIIRSQDGDLTHAEFKIAKYDYIRISIVDKDGKKAWTNPIYLND